MVSHVFTGLSEEAEERSVQTNELHNRYKNHSNMVLITDDDGVVTGMQQGPVFFEDKCCGATSHLNAPLGDWPPGVSPLADEYHIVNRIMDAVKCPGDAHDLKMKVVALRTELRSCFSDVPGQPGRYITGQEILQKLEDVRANFLKEGAGGLWTAEVQAAFTNATPHILKCFELPPHIHPSLRDRNGKIVLKRGTNAQEAFWR